MSSSPDPFQAFRTSSENSPEFFPSFKQRAEDHHLRNRLEEILGKLNEKTFVKLKALASKDFERAVSEYLDTDYLDEEPNLSKPIANPIHQETIPNTASSEPLKTLLANKRTHDDSTLVKPTDLHLENLNHTVSTRDGAKIQQHLQDLDCKKSAKPEGTLCNTANCENDPLKINKSVWNNDCRYLGSFQARPYYTRPGQSWTKHGDTLKIDRIGARSPKSQESLQVKFFNSDGLDFARASTEDAIILSPLIDAGVCMFEAQVIFVEPSVKVGTSFDVEIRCYFKKSAFSKKSTFTVSRRSPKKTIADESKETQEEILIRLRQVALVNLFNRVGLSSSIPEISQVVSDLRNSGSSSAPSALMNPEKKEELEIGVTLDKNQLDFLNAKTESVTQKFSGPGVDPGDTFSFTLKPYQKRGLAWMLECERDANHISEKNLETHPLWTELNWPEKDPFWANLNSGELSLARPTLASQCRGGILGDEMGLGKTIQMAALIHSGENESPRASTLVVVDKSLLGQWESELNKARKTTQSCGCFLFYEKSEPRDLREFLFGRNHKRKVVITTYGKLQSAHKHFLSDKESGLFDVIFDRVILDEAHRIKNRSTLSAKACFDVRSHRRWALTGTPITNRLEDLFSLIRFIGVEPWGTFNYWKYFVTDPFSRPETRFRALKTVQAIVAPIILRRTKDMKDPKTGEFLIELPKKTINKKIVEFSEDERTLYSHLFARVRDSVAADFLDGKPRYTTILALITQLRQVCCHPALLIKKTKPEPSQTLLTAPSAFLLGSKRRKTEDYNQDEIINSDENNNLDLEGDIKSMIEKFSSSVNEYASNTLEALLDKSSHNEECPICFDELTQPLFTECLHSACRSCMVKSVKKRGMCPLCNKPVDSACLMILDEATAKFRFYDEDKERLRVSYKSSKIVALISELQRFSQQKLGKSLVFSQFASYLNIIEESLVECGIQVYRFDGSMSHHERNMSIESFKSSTCENAVLLLTLKAGCVGLNLTEAKQVFLMDPWWNWATEEQACGRVHRVGQDTPVNITRFIIKGSIEERMLKLQERKAAISDVVTADEDEPKNFEDIKLLLGLDGNFANNETK